MILDLYNLMAKDAAPSTRAGTLIFTLGVFFAGVGYGLLLGDHWVESAAALGIAAAALAAAVWFDKFVKKQRAREHAAVLEEVSDDDDAVAPA